MSSVNNTNKDKKLLHDILLSFFQGLFGESEKVKWRGTWVVQTRIKRHIHKPVELYVSLWFWVYFYKLICQNLKTFTRYLTNPYFVLCIGYRILSAKDNTLLRELRHPNIVQFLGSIVQGEEMILITEYLSRVSLSMPLKYA